MATPPAATLVVEAEWPRRPVSVGMVAQFDVSFWACHAMHKVVALAFSWRPSLAGWISAVWSVCIEQLLYPECCLACLCAALVLVFAVVPVSHAGVAFLALSDVILI